MKALDEVSALEFHISELMPYSGSIPGRDLGILIANCESVIHFCTACDRSRITQETTVALDEYLRVAIELRINALHGLNSEKVTVAKEQVAEYFDILFESADALVSRCCVPGARDWLTAASGA